MPRVSGCLTCRSKRVKCDEQRPVCARCKRLSLNCHPADSMPRITVKERRQGLGSWRHRNKYCWLPSPLLPRPPHRCSSSRSSSINLDFPLHDLSEAASPDRLPDVEALAKCGQMASQEQPLYPLDDYSSKQFIPIMAAQLQHNIDHAGADQFINPLLQLDQHIQFDGVDCVSSTSEPIMHECTSTAIPRPSYGLSTHHIALPNSLTLTVDEHHALKHFRTAYALSLTAKDPQWSLPSLLLHLCSYNNMAVHFILGTSIYDLEAHNRSPPHKSTTAEHHFEQGSKFLIQSSTLGTYPGDSVAILTSFLFKYIYMSRQPNMNPIEIGCLSQTILNFIKTFLLKWESLIPSLTGSPNQFQIPRWTTSSESEQALLARLIAWLYIQDVQSSLYGCGGDLARYFHGNKIRSIWETARLALLLNWGENYPGVEDDIEASQSIDMFVDVAQTRFEIIIFSQTPLAERCLEYDRLGQQLDSLERVGMASMINGTVLTDISNMRQYFVSHLQTALMSRK
jgi:hypothetical protein